MSWIMIKRPHPLDAIWRIANERHDEAQEALDNLPDNAPDHEVDAATDVLTEARLAILSLPARSMDDCIIKLMASGVESGSVMPGCDISAIVNEMAKVLDEACHRGRDFMKEPAHAQ